MGDSDRRKTPCKGLSCDCLEGVYCRKTVSGEDTFECQVPEWTLCVTGCEFIHNRAVRCGTEEIFVPGTILVQYVWFDGSSCRYGACRIPANFCFENPCVGESEKVLACNCCAPRGSCHAQLVVERDRHTGKRRHAKVVVRARTSLETCCLVDVRCPRHQHGDKC